MANLTFIIGNGLDLSLKMETSYRSFYEYVRLKKLHPNNNIYKHINVEEVNWWVDFELGLGKYTNKIELVPENERDEWSEKLNDELNEVNKDLKQYINDQNKKVAKKTDGIKFTVQSCYEELVSGQRVKVQSALGGSKFIDIRFITLNYTDVLEQIFADTERPSTSRNFYTPQEPHHLHGSVHRTISLGVNDESQLSSYIADEEKKYLIKPQLIEEMNDGRLETFNQYVDIANVIVLFGVSLGASDTYIWEKVAAWLSASNSNILVIHHHEKGLDLSDMTDRDYLRMYDRVKNKFLDNANITSPLREILKKKIFVVPNSTELFKPEITEE